HLRPGDLRLVRPKPRQRLAPRPTHVGRARPRGPRVGRALPRWRAVPGSALRPARVAAARSDVGFELLPQERVHDVLALDALEGHDGRLAEGQVAAGPG